MSEMVDRVATVIFVMAPEHTWPSPNHPRCQEIARRAIEAMQDPSQEMKVALEKGVNWVGHIEQAHNWEGIGKAWNAAIDEALK